MPPRIQILENVLKRLERADEPAIGLLYGVMYDGIILIVGFGFEPLSGEETASFSRYIGASVSRVSMRSFDFPHLIYPTGIDFCGIITVGGQWFENDESSEVISPRIKKLLKEVLVTNNPVYLTKNLETNEIKTYHLQHENVVAANYDELKYSEFCDKFAYVRLKSDITSSIKMNTQEGDLRIFHVLVKRVQDGLCYGLGSSKQPYIYKYNAYGHERTVRTLYNSASKERDVANNLEVLCIKPFFPKAYSLQREIPLYPRSPLYRDKSSTGTIGEEEELEEDDEIDSEVTLNLPYDGLCIVQREKNISELYSVVTDAAERILLISEYFVTRHFQDLDNLKGFTTNHYFHEELGHPLTYLSLSQEEDLEELEFRRELHQNLHLTLERPYFRRANRLNFISSKISPPALINVHEGIRQLSAWSPNIKQALVYGKYAYYHYMMGGMNDQGWGCAYRSLQTLCSWFRLQGYSENDIPTHEEIQKALVDIGDKEPNFVGSKQWIGSTEVGFFLESKWDISSRIQYVSSGSEMNTITEVLLEHFTVQGTPIMIGGGVLAHTILGVQFCEDSGETFFLVLDPHYTGTDDLATIQKKGYIGWKGVSYWEQKAFYNLLLPQRKICF